MTDWSLWLELLARSAVLLAGGEALRRCGKAHGAAFRHRLLLCVCSLLHMLLVLSVLFPEIRIPLWRPVHGQTALVTVQEISSEVMQRPSRQSINWPVAIWLMGVVIALTPILAGA